MHRDGYYSSGEFAKKANVSVRTVRFYDKQNILKPSLLTDDGTRFYTDSDFTRLQQILLLKYLGFSLADIRDMTIGDSDYHVLMNSIKLQKRMIQDKIAQMQLVYKAMEDIEKSINSEKRIDWSNMLELIHLTNMEDSMKNQYINAGNISARINLHNRFSVNKQGWFPWIYDQLQLVKGMKVLELGCGDGTLWVSNVGKLARLGRRDDEDNGNKRKVTRIELTDISSGMISDAKRNVENAISSWKERDIDISFKYAKLACENTDARDGQYDLVIANHVLFYCDNIDAALKEINRIIKPGGRFICSTYGSHHMQEINTLVSNYDKRIVLESEKLFEKFGLDNGYEFLKKYFNSIDKRYYKDALVVDEANPLVDYVLSCHGNQKEYLVDKYSDFKKYVEKHLRKPMTITKEAGIFVCTK